MLIVRIHNNPPVPGADASIAADADISIDGWQIGELSIRRCLYAHMSMAYNAIIPRVSRP